MTSPKTNKLPVFFLLGAVERGDGNPCVKKEGRKKRTGGTQADDGGWRFGANLGSRRQGDREPGRRQSRADPWRAGVGRVVAVLF